MTELDSIARLAAHFAALPGVGKKTAGRYAYFVVRMSSEQADSFATAITNVKQRIRLCDTCGNFTDEKNCYICVNRNKSTILVVKEPKDIMAIERAKEYRGVYHVLHGVLDPSSNIGPDDIRIKELLARLDEVEEVILATNPDLTGEATALYISKLLKPFNIKTSRIAHGLPIGADIEYADEMTLMRAITDRKEL